MALTIENAWHFNGGLWQDLDLKRVKSSRLAYDPAPLSLSDASQDGVYTIRGPRRAGKTVSIKLLIANLIEKQGWNPHSIVALTADTFRSMGQLEDSILEIKKKFPLKFLFIDEVTAVKDWQKVIKKLRDTGVLQEICTVVSGSSSYDLKRGSERLAGRKGASGADRVVLPMSYPEFKKQVSESDDFRAIRLYSRCGGFPFRISEYLEQGEQSLESSLGVFDDVIFSEFQRRKLDRNLGLEVLARLSAVRISAVSYQSFASAIHAKQETIRKYLDALGDCFVLASYFSFDVAKKRVAPKKDKKFLWIDPALGEIFSYLKLGENPPFEDRAEWMVGAHLLRHFEARLWEGLSAPRNVFTWKSSTGKEIDFLLVDRSRNFYFPIEVKQQNTISPWDFQVLEQGFKKGLLITKTDRIERAVSMGIPLADFLSAPLQGWLR